MSDLQVHSPIDHAIVPLARFTRQGIAGGLEPIRLARATHAMLIAGCSTQAPFPGISVASYLISAQHEDGGWGDVEETTWCLGYLRAFGNRYAAEIARAKGWLASQRLICGAWGRSSRDRSRIPITALLCALVPEAVDENALDWIANEWECDLSAQVQLTYKGGFFLLAQGHPKAKAHGDIVERTVRFLGAEQDDGGGFGPWKGHPLGSDPWSTGAVLWGLSRLGGRAPLEILSSAVSWLHRSQLTDGTWPYHYIDDGTSMAIIGLANATPLLKE